MPNDPSIQPLLLTRAQTAMALALSIDVVDQIIKSGELRAVRVGRRVMIDRRDLLNWIDRMKSTAATVGLMEVVR